MIFPLLFTRTHTHRLIKQPKIYNGLPLSNFSTECNGVYVKKERKNELLFVDHITNHHHHHQELPPINCVNKNTQQQQQKEFCPDDDDDGDDEDRCARVIFLSFPLPSSVVTFN